MMHQTYLKSLAPGITALLLTLSAIGQDKFFPVSGKVVDETTKNPLPGASVFCQNTTSGTITNNDGAFFLRLNNGGYDLVIS